MLEFIGCLTFVAPDARSESRMVPPAPFTRPVNTRVRPIQICSSSPDQLARRRQ